MNSSLQKTAIIILAAGSSNRMKGVKQLLPWKHTTLLGNAIEQALASNAEDVFVVLGSDYTLISKEIMSDRITIIKNKNWPDGMGSSIACAVDYISNISKKYETLLIILVDQPLIDVTYLNHLINSSMNYNIIASKYNNRVGVPAIFSSLYFDDLKLLNKDRGARDLILKNIKYVKVIDAFNKIQDVDTMESYNQLYQKYGKI